MLLLLTADMELLPSPYLTVCVRVAVVGVCGCAGGVGKQQRRTQWWARRRNIRKTVHAARVATQVAPQSASGAGATLLSVVPQQAATPTAATPPIQQQLPAPAGGAAIARVEMQEEEEDTTHDGGVGAAARCAAPQTASAVVALRQTPTLPAGRADGVGNTAARNSTTTNAATFHEDQRDVVDTRIMWWESRDCVDDDGDGSGVSVLGTYIYTCCCAGGGSTWRRARPCSVAVGTGAQATRLNTHLSQLHDGAIVCLGRQIIRSLHSVHGGAVLGVCVRLIVWAGSVAVADTLAGRQRREDVDASNATRPAFQQWTALARRVLVEACANLTPSKLGQLRDNVAL